MDAVRLTFVSTLMTRLLFVALTLLGGGIQAQEINKPAPLFEVATNFKPVRLADLKGRVVYVDFWVSWCAPCNQSFPWMNEMQVKYGSRGFSVIGISLDEKREDADRFLATKPAKFQIGYDPEGKIGKLYRLRGMPTSYLIGADGHVRAVHVGFRDSERNDLEREIEAALTSARRK